MSYYDRIDVSEGVNINKTNTSKVFVTIGTFSIKDLSFNQMSAMAVMTY